MIYRGTVRGGVVVLQPAVHLPEALKVTVVPVAAESPQYCPDRFLATMRNGVPVFPRKEGGTAPGLDLVNQLRDETP